MAGASLDDVIPLHLATVTFPDFHPLRGQTGEVMGFAIRHRGGLVLFDTGIGTGNPLIDRHYQPVHHSIAETLARHEHALDDVTAIVNSHLHFDHCGNNPLFPGVPIYAQASELELTKDPAYTVPDWIGFEGAEYRPIDGNHVIADGMWIVGTPGHTAGHQSLVLDGLDGTILLAGQAIYSKVEYDFIRERDSLPEDDPPADPERYLASARQLIALHPRRVHFSHDAATWESTNLPRPRG